ncbi:oxygen tolerance protein BatD [Dysgonomonas alginatilytica]|uniref:Oxygen tolerance protein BatD n=1 Tax=Dysgonomonas alginatilytica TaxID=1605892 RepID=A0A2V3PMS9_9BACT|nr:BatD family protein [Dysgonomonas alginatilytica]PXV63576.1 oxygen tolerance protein BatD [Dysgonomonas alginatilytica]
MGVTNKAATFKFLVILLLFASIEMLNAGDITFEVKYPRVVNAGETFRLEYILKGSREGINFMPPKFSDGFEMKSGPHIYNYSGSSDGDYEIWKSFLYIVQANKKGVFTIPVSAIEVEGKEYKTSIVELKVLGEHESKEEYYDIDAFLRTQVSRPEIYEGEAVVLSCQLFTKVRLLSVKQIDYPVLDDFEVGSKPFYDHQGIPVFRKEDYNGSQYSVSDLRKIIIYPNRTGKLAITEVEASLSFDTRILDRTKRGYYAGEDQVRGVDKLFKSEPISVRVVRLPGNKPDDFSDAIGKFKLRSEIKGSQPKVGDLFALSLIVDGVGDLSIASAPVLDLPEGIEVYDMKSEDYSFFGDLGIQSDKTFGYLLIAQKAGTYRIPPVRFVYLDTDSGTYKVLTSSEYTVTVTEPKLKGTVVAGLY